MQDHGIEFDKGLSDEEIKTVETAYRIKFPPDLKVFLSLGLPISDGFVNWRTLNQTEIVNKLQFPVKSLLFKVKYRDFWLESWGLRPCEPEMAHEVASSQLQSQPKLIPIYKQSHIPEEPYEMGNPVLSVSQSKITYEGGDLIQFFIRKFQIAIPDYFPLKESNEISFWAQVAQ